MKKFKHLSAYTFKGLELHYTSSNTDMQHWTILHAWSALGLTLKSWHEERTNGTKGANRNTPAHAPSTWIQLTVVRRWSEGGFQLTGVCVLCVCVSSHEYQISHFF